MSSSEEDVPAPSPSAAVVARRAGREAKSMREESGSDKDAEEPEEWDDDGEASSDEGESDEEARVSNAQRGRVRLHGVSQSSAGLEVDDDRRKSLGEKGWARRAVVVRAVEPSGAADFEAVPGREEYDFGRGRLSRVGEGHARVRRRQLQRCWQRGTIDGSARSPSWALWGLL